MTTNTTAPEFTPMTKEDSRSRGKLSLVIGLILGGLVLSFYAVTIVRIKDNLARRQQLEAQGIKVPPAIPGAPRDRKSSIAGKRLAK